MAYTELHVALVTFIRSVGSIEEAALVAAYRRISAKLSSTVPTNSSLPEAANSEPAESNSLAESNSSAEPPAEFVATINEINARLAPFGLKIAKHRHQLQNSLHYIFINTNSDALIRGNTGYSPPELDALKQLIDDIVLLSNYKFLVGLVNANQRISTSLNRTVREGSDLLNSFVDNGWLDLMDSRVVLLLRSVCELKHFLVERYGLVEQDQDGKIFSCSQCKELVTHGVKCSTCFTSFHHKCVYIYRKQSSDCPACKHVLATDPVGLQPTEYHPK